MITHVLPLLVFTTFAGLAAGAYVIDALCGPLRHGDGRAAGAGSRAWVFPLVCLVLLGVGLCGTLAHLGQPLRFVNGMANPGSMIAQEAYWSIAFGIVIVADLVWAKVKGAALRPLRWVGAAVAVGLMAVTGLAYYLSLGLPPWSGAATIPLFVVGDLALGAALCALLDGSALEKGKLACANVAAGIAFAVVLVALGLHLARVGADATALLVAAGVAGPGAASVVAAATHAGKLPERTGAVAVFALAAVGVVVARYAFFAAGML